MMLLVAELEPLLRCDPLRNSGATRVFAEADATEPFSSGEPRDDIDADSKRRLPRRGIVDTMRISAPLWTSTKGARLQNPGKQKGLQTKVCALAAPFLSSPLLDGPRVGDKYSRDAGGKDPAAEVHVL